MNASISRRHWLAATLATACLPTASWLTAAEKDPFAPSPKTRPNAGEAASQVPPEPRPEGESPAVDRTRERQLLRAAQRTVVELSAHGENAFNRGLLPLGDYLQQVSLVTQIGVMSAEANGTSAAGALQRQIERLRDVRDRLHRFNQPAAEGWSADLALSEWALANAELDLATRTGDVVGQHAAMARKQEWAGEHYQRRHWDAGIGAAPLSAMSLAEELIVKSSVNSNERNALAAVHQIQLDTVAAVTAQWHEQGAGIGRADRVLQSRFATHVNRLVSVDRQGAAVVNRDAVRAADADLDELFATQVEFHQHGTARVFDLARTWKTWRDLHEVAADAPEIVTRQQSARRAGALRILDDLANDTEDRRGRNAADVAFVELLVQLNDVDAVRDSTATSRSYLR